MQNKDIHIILNINQFIKKNIIIIKLIKYLITKYLTLFN